MSGDGIMSSTKHAQHIVYECTHRDYNTEYCNKLTDHYKEWLVRALVQNVGYECRLCGKGITLNTCRCSACGNYDLSAYNYTSQGGYDLWERGMRLLPAAEHKEWRDELQKRMEGKECYGCPGMKIEDGWCWSCQYCWDMCFDETLPRCRYNFEPNPPSRPRALGDNCTYLLSSSQEVTSPEIK
jgi:hypothetical protein